MAPMGVEHVGDAMDPLGKLEACVERARAAAAEHGDEGAAEYMEHLKVHIADARAFEDKTFLYLGVFVNRLGSKVVVTEEEVERMAYLALATSPTEEGQVFTMTPLRGTVTD